METRSIRAWPNPNGGRKLAEEDYTIRVEEFNAGYHRLLMMLKLLITKLLITKWSGRKK
jgi:hypothetical protein